MTSKYFISIAIVILFWNGNATGQNKNWFDIARHGNLDDIKKLVSKNPEAVDAIDSNKSSMLILACYYENKEVAEFLANKTSNINYQSDMGSALLAAAVKGNVEITSYLLQSGADSNSHDGNNTTALIYAVLFKNSALIKVLLSHNADKSLVDKNGKSAFEYAVQSNNNEIIDLLK